MIGNLSRALCSWLVIIAVSVFSTELPAFAQTGPNTAPYITASWATQYARYYAPYALQASAAYLSVSTFDQTRGPNEQPALDGADVAYAVSPYQADLPTVARATKYLRAWQYQFGSDQYLRCFDNSDTECQKELGSSWTFSIGSGPAFQVWARTHFPHVAHDACTEVAIAFRGTAGLIDWVSNADPVSHYLADDYYLQLRRNINAIVKKIASLDCYKRAARVPQIVSVGHSLGGGLAQFVALANKPSGPRITKVFAFDSSPVTGSSLLDKQTLSQNASGLEIDRIYQSGEVLASLRKYYEQYPKSSSACGPLVRTVVFDAFRAPSSVGLHSMASLASQTVQLSYDGDTQLSFKVPGAGGCSTRYRPPSSDEDETPAPNVYTGETAYRSDGTVMTVAQANPYLSTNRFSRAQRSVRKISTNRGRAMKTASNVH
jgi:Protein of unknown function (DUF2974)